MNANEYHGLVRDLFSAGKQYAAFRLLGAEKIITRPRFTKNFETVIAPDGTPAGTDEASYEKEVLRLYHAAFPDEDKLERAMKDGKEFSAIFHFGDPDDQTMVDVSWLDGRLDVYVTFHCPASWFDVTVRESDKAKISDKMAKEYAAETCPYFETLEELDF